jgi:luciferase family oxidoreductase group 1
MIPFSVLDLSPITQGAGAAEALRNSRDLAQHAERLGFHRYWLAEHHNMPGIASAATSIVIAHVAAATQTIRVGSGGIMLPNHSPLVIAEQFGTLAALYPGRIDLGLGRAPGTDQSTARALRRDLHAAAEAFPEDVLELQRLLGDAAPGQRLRAIPGTGTHVPLWILGSSLFGAQLAGAYGLPFAFASHFAPDLLFTALDLYRQRFQPSAQLARPYAMVGLGVFAADTDEEARRLFTSQQQQFLNLRRGTPTPLQPPVDEVHMLPAERAMLEQALSMAVVGNPSTVKAGLKEVMRRTQADELILAAQIYEHRARVRSYEIVAQVRAELEAETQAEADRV